MLRESSKMIVGWLLRKSDELMRNEKFVTVLVRVFKYSFALLVIILLGNMVSMLA